MDLIGLLYGLGILQGLVLAGILLFASSDHRMANAYMAALVAAIALHLLRIWFIRTGFFLQHPTGWMLIPALTFAWGPLLFLYSYSLTSRSVGWRHGLHFFPTLLLMLAASLSFWGSSAEEQSVFLRYFWSPRTDPQLTAQVAETVPAFWRIWVDWHLQGNLFTLHFGTYCFLVLRQIRHHNRRLEQHFSSLEYMNLRWLRTLTLICLVYLLLYLIFNRTLVLKAGYFDSNALAPSAPFIFLVVLVYIIAIAATLQSSLIRGGEIAGEEVTAPEDGETPQVGVEDRSGKYARSGLSTADAERYKLLLMERMEEERYYLDCDLTLPELANQVGLSPHQVSQIINEQLGQSFFSFVNNYRIQLAKRLMTEQETRNMPIVELALEVGFKSRSSFYSAFKKVAQMTPTQFKKNPAGGEETHRSG